MNVFHSESIYENDNDEVITKHRLFKNGIMQESKMFIIKDKNADLHITSGDSVWDVWKDRKKEYDVLKSEKKSK